MKQFFLLFTFYFLLSPLSAQSVKVAKLKYDGGGDWYVNEYSLPELLKFVRANTMVDVPEQPDVVDLDSDKIFDYPFVHLTGHGNISLSITQVERLRRYLENGGFLHADDNYGLDKALRRELKKVFPEQELIELPFNHPVYKQHFNFDYGLPKIHEHDGKPPQGFGLFHNGRLVVFYSYESDLGDGWEPEFVHKDPPEKRLAALQMGVNLLVYALTN
jgi:Domain of unknown function (DUF4159)